MVRNDMRIGKEHSEESAKEGCTGEKGIGRPKTRWEDET